MSVPTTPSAQKSAREMLTDAEFTRVRRTVMDANPAMPEEMAGRIVEEGIKFVAACAAAPGTGLAPSRVVDEGWHALILHTALYAELCDRLGGGFVHHFPGWDPTHYDPEILDRTRAQIRACGYTPDPELWGHPTEGLLVPVAARCQHAPECTIMPMPPDPGPTD
ncbi:glycine-rich domain-containing protein [Streptomyces sp. URMC 125]|uniref:glycine-rich domain-containing protein n=1 Tax=Streptomyces sp. URMC 125 TaxID=3423419 RepID=UPI003F194F9A